MPQVSWKALLITTTSSPDPASVGSLNVRREEPRIRVRMGTDSVGELVDEPIGEDRMMPNPGNAHSGIGARSMKAHRPIGLDAR